MDLHEIVRKLIMDYAHALINKKKLVSMCVNITFEQEHLTTTQYTAKQIHFFFLSFFPIVQFQFPEIAMMFCSKCCEGAGYSEIQKFVAQLCQFKNMIFLLHF
jgi:hypothetical protein